MSTFSESSAGSSAIRSLDLEDENTVSEENWRGMEVTRLESVGKESDYLGLGLVLTRRELDVLRREVWVF